MTEFAVSGAPSDVSRFGLVKNEVNLTQGLPPPAAQDQKIAQWMRLPVLTPTVIPSQKSPPLILCRKIIDGPIDAISKFTQVAGANLAGMTVATYAGRGTITITGVFIGANIAAGIAAATVAGAITYDVYQDATGQCPYPPQK